MRINTVLLLYLRNNYVDSVLVGVFTNHFHALEYCTTKHPEGKDVGSENRFNFRANDGKGTHYSIRRVRVNAEIKD